MRVIAIFPHSPCSFFLHCAWVCLSPQVQHSCGKANRVNATTSSLSSATDTAAASMPSLTRASCRATGAVPHYQLPTLSHPQRPSSSTSSSSGHHQLQGRSSIKTTPTSSPGTRGSAGGRPFSGDNQRVRSRGSRNSSGAPSRRSLDDESFPSAAV